MYRFYVILYDYDLYDPLRGFGKTYPVIREDWKRFRQACATQSGSEFNLLFDSKGERAFVTNSQQPLGFERCLQRMSSILKPSIQNQRVYARRYGYPGILSPETVWSPLAARFWLHMDEILDFCITSAGLQNIGTVIAK